MKMKWMLGASIFVLCLSHHLPVYSEDDSQGSENRFIQALESIKIVPGTIQHKIVPGSIHPLTPLPASYKSSDFIEPPAQDGAPPAEALVDSNYGKNGEQVIRLRFGGQFVTLSQADIKKFRDSGVRLAAYSCGEDLSKMYMVYQPRLPSVMIRRGAAPGKALVEFYDESFISADHAGSKPSSSAEVDEKDLGGSSFWELAACSSVPASVKDYLWNLAAHSAP